MKKTFCSALMLMGVLAAQAALPKVASVEKVALPDGMSVSMAALSPDGSYAVISPLSGSGLSRLDLSTKEVTEISKTASPMMLEFSADGQNVLFRESSYDSTHHRLVSLKAYNVADGRTATIIEKSRSLEGFGTDGQTAVAVENGKMRTRALGSAPLAVKRATLSIKYGQLCVTKNGVTTSIAPLGKECNSYLWPSLSPDGSRILAFGVGTGAFTCNLDGSDVHVLGMARSPKWLDNDVVVAMEDYDNGRFTTESTIKAFAADGSENVALTGKDVVAVFPTAAPGKVAFTTPDGEMYIINLK